MSFVDKLDFLLLRYVIRTLEIGRRKFKLYTLFKRYRYIKYRGWIGLPGVQVVYTPQDPRGLDNLRKRRRRLHQQSRIYDPRNFNEDGTRKEGT